MIILKIKSILLDHLMTIAVSVGVYFAWYIHGADSIVFDLRGFFIIYIVVYTFQTVSLVLNNHLHSSGEFKAGIRLINQDGSEPGKAKVMFRHLTYPLFLINALWWPPFAVVLIIYLSMKQTSENELIDGLTPVTKLKYVPINKADSQHKTSDEIS